MSKKIYNWKMPLIVGTIALALLALYPLSDKVIRKEQVKEVNGQVVERLTLEKSFLAFLERTPIRKEVILKEETTPEGKKVKEKVVEELAKGRMKLGLDLRGGSELLYRVRVEPGEDRPGITQETIDVLKKRIDPKGIMEYRLQEQGFRRILVQVPGATKGDIESLKERIVRLGKLEFRLAAAKESAEYQEALAGRPVPGYYKHWVGKKREETGELTEDWYLVRNKIELSGESLARVFPDRKNVQPVVGFEFNPEGKSKFSQLTERNIGKPLAIILDGILYSAPVIRERIPGRGIIEGNFTQQEVNDLIAVMRAGSLPADLELEMEMSVGPSLGRDSIRNGLFASLVGSFFVVAFMGMYYLGAGMVANLAMALNLFLVVGTMALLGATLTLPGIAGLALIVGMAVDANVLILERIREEKAKGKAIPLAMKAGYERAFTTIIDSNLTTLITGLILYAVGTGPIKGFAITLSIGILINLFTAVFVTRVIFELLDMKEFKMMLLFQRPNISFAKYFRFWVTASTLVILMGLGVFKWRGIDKYDIDFTGGTLIHLQLDSPTPAGTVRSTLAQWGYGDAEVQGIWGTTAMAAEPSEFGIRVKGLGGEKVKEKLSGDFRKALEGFSIYFGETPESFKLELQNPLEESDLRKRLAQVGYTEEDVLSLMPLGVVTKDFEITVPALKEEKVRPEVIGKLAQAMPGLLFYDVGMEFGEIKELEPQPGPTGMPVARGSLELDLSRPLDPELIQMELLRSGYSGISVIRREERGRRLLSARLEVQGSKDTLESIKGGMKRSLKLPAFTFLSDTSLGIELESPVDEETLQAQLQGVALGVTRIVTQKAPSKNFWVGLNPLREGKVQEKIREDILSAFKDNLYKETVEVSFESLPETAVAPARVGDSPPVAVGEAEHLLRMTLSKAMPKERIEDALAREGYSGCLAEALEPGMTYKTVKLRIRTSEQEGMKVALSQAFLIPEPLKRVVSIGSTVAGEMKNRASLALIFSMVAIIFYIWFRFGELSFGVAAVLALVHDVCFTMGAVAVAGYYPDIFGDIKINLSMIASFLTLVGYSLNDTIVIFDRIRENMAGRKSVDANLVNDSINQTLSRTALTGVTTFFVVTALYFLAGTELHGFAFVMIVGVLVGTYSSIFIASPILVHWMAVKRGFGIIFWVLTSPLWVPWRVWRRIMGGTPHPHRA
ncbi:MAG: protein translocase subunit SecD [Candidatus Brocadiales bacterium]|nr:protein translocase subunit SecD [Candidatus Brocadiales bacterium]